MAIYVFHHIPKCGGTSCLSAFSEWFRVVPDYRADVDPLSTEKFVTEKLDLSSLDDSCLLAGHFECPGAHLHQRYPELLSNDRFRLITFVRDPLELAQSLHFYQHAYGNPNRSPSLSAKLASLENFVAEKVLPCNMGNYRSVIDRYFFVGLTERMQESFDLLARILGKDRVIIPHLRATPRSELVTENDLNQFQANNPLDYLIYDYCCERFEETRDAFS